MNVKGGHFLSEDVALFDANFFNFTSELASVRRATRKDTYTHIHTGLRSTIPTSIRADVRGI